MNKFYLLVCVFLMFSSVVHAQTTKVIIKKDGKHRLQMNKKIQQALTKAAPTFKQYLPENYPKDLPEEYKFNESQMLSAVVGDFNGDGKKDIVLLGADKDGDIAYQVISKGKDYEVSEFWNGRFGDHQDIPKLYHAKGKWSYGMRYFTLRPAGAYYKGLTHKGKEDSCPYESVLSTSNADGTRNFYLCWRDGDLQWDNASGD